MFLMLNDEKLLFLLKWGKNASFSSYLHLRIGLDRIKAVVFLLTQLSMSGLMYLPVFAIQSTILAACLVDAADFCRAGHFVLHDIVLVALDVEATVIAFCALDIIHSDKMSSLFISVP